MITYGLWNAHAGRWLLANSGRRFETTDPDRALDALLRLRKDGALGVEMRIVSPERGLVPARRPDA